MYRRPARGRNRAGRSRIQAYRVLSWSWVVSLSLGGSSHEAEAAGCTYVAVGTVMGCLLPAAVSSKLTEHGPARRGREDHLVGPGSISRRR